MSILARSLSLLTVAAGLVWAVAAPAAPLADAALREQLLPPVTRFALTPMPQEPDAIESIEAPAGAPRRWWPIALSAVVPGLGEAITGHWQGYALIAADAGFIYGAIDQNDEGDRIEKEYKAFADTHYSESEWRIALNEGRLEEFFDLPPGSTPESDVALYVTKEEDEREWYENIGKWDVFAWGWREYWPSEDDYQPDPANPIYSTPLRDEYVAMRGKSNDAFGRADTFTTLSLLLRVFSVLEMAYLEGFIGGRYNSAGPEDPPSVSFAMDHRGLDETRIGLKVSY